jgi:hypothetical protein
MHFERTQGSRQCLPRDRFYGSNGYQLFPAKWVLTLQDKGREPKMSSRLISGFTVFIVAMFLAAPAFAQAKPPAQDTGLTSYVEFGGTTNSAGTNSIPTSDTHSASTSAWTWACRFIS